MQLIRRYRLPALFCALAVLLCELISRPYTSMGISDDGPYILIARHLAATGHIVYNGWASPIMGWQLYLGAVFIKLFGFSFTTVRMSTLLVAMALAFTLQRTLVRAGITERNATIGTIALVLSPLYLMLSVTFMTDIPGLFAIVICIYGCLRALQSSTSRAAILWLCFAVVANTLCGTSRQVAWLGILVIVPCTLWLLRSERRVLLAGIVANFTGVLLIFACMQWFKHQPYTMPEKLFPGSFYVASTAHELFHFLWEFPFLLIPIVALFLPQVLKSRLWLKLIALGFLATYALVAIHKGYLPLLEPIMQNKGNWIGVHGIHEGSHLHGEPPIFLHTPVRLLFTIASIGGVLGLIATVFGGNVVEQSPSGTRISWSHLNVLVIPFVICYSLLLIPRAASGWFFDRYALELLVVALIYLVRYYQEQVQRRLPLGGILLAAAMAIYGILVTHNQFSLYRARVALATELRANGIPDTSVDNGFEYNFVVELQHANHINEEDIAIPANAYVPTPPLPAGTCTMFWHDKTPHIHPLYDVSFDPNACYGPAPFVPVHYSRWPFSKPGTLYVVHSILTTKQ